MLIFETDWRTTIFLPLFRMYALLCLVNINKLLNKQNNYSGLGL